MLPVHRGLTALAATATATVLLAAGTTSAHASPEKVNPPDRISSMGDSITRGFHTGGLLQDVPANSWSTGTNATVNSLYARIRAVNQSATQTNRAVTGAKMAGLAEQAAAVVADAPDVATILLGANDACTGTEAAMTPVATYEQQFRAAMTTLSAGLPDTQVLVASVPDLRRLHEIGRTSATARFWWGLYGICQSMLANPTSTTAADVARRARVGQRVIDYNAVLRDVCGEYALCRYDGDAAFNTPFLLSDMSTIDFFHPNVAGQRKAAAVLAEALLDLDDVTPPSTIVTRTGDEGADGWFRGDVQIALGSTDPDLSGSQYDFTLSGAQSRTWREYVAPFTVSAEGETTLTARSVDVAGNVEAGQTSTVRIDRTAPTVAVACPTGPVVQNGPASATVEASDALSGFALDPNGSFPLDTSVVGLQQHQVEVQDRAGNTAQATCAFRVAYGYSGLQQPVSADGSSVFKAGSTVPLKFTLADAAGVTTVGAVPTLSVTRISTAVSGPVTEEPLALAPSTGNRFVWFGDAGEYRYNLSTRGLSAGTYELTITLDGGQVHTEQISLR